MNGDRYNPPASTIMMIATFIMFTTLRPILIPPTDLLLLNATNPKPGTTEAEFRVVIQVATKSFWLFCNLAFAFALVAALVQVRKHSRISLKLVIVTLLCMWLSVNCVAVVRVSFFIAFWFLLQH